MSVDRSRIILVFVALVAVWPALHPATRFYLDNPSHLTEVAALAQEILPEERWFTGWTVRANAGFAVNQVNAPLLWALVAMLERVGLPRDGVYIAGAALANVIYALGAARLAERLTQDRWTAFLAAAVSAACPNDLYGFAGAVGGMWPHRLANGLVLLGLASRRRDPLSVGVWLALTLWCHTYSGMAAAALVGGGIVESAFRREVGRFGRLVGGAALGALLSCAFWVPLLEAAVRPDLPGGPRFWSIQDTLVWLFLPMNPMRLSGLFDYLYIGDYWGFPLSLAILFGLGAAVRARPRFADPALAARLGVFLLLLFLAIAAVVPLTRISAFGPNPWRQLTLLRFGLVLIAAMALAPALPRGPTIAALFLLAGLTGAAGSAEMGLPFSARARALHADLQVVWSELEELDPPGVLYHQNTNLNPEVDWTFAYAQVGVMPAADAGRPTIGTWYAVTPIVSERHTRSERLLFFGRGYQRYTEDHAALMRRIRAFRVGSLVTIDRRAASLLAQTEGLRQVLARGPFALWAVETPDLEHIQITGIELTSLPGSASQGGDEGGDEGAGPEPQGVMTPSPSGAELRDVSWRRGGLSATVDTTGPTGILFRETWHPWWRGTLDGTPIVLREDRATGLVYSVLPGAGRLELEWRDQTRWTVWPLGFGWLGVGLVGVWRLVRRR